MGRLQPVFSIKRLAQQKKKRGQSRIFYVNIRGPKLQMLAMSFGIQITLKRLGNLLAIVFRLITDFPLQLSSIESCQGKF